MTLVGITIEYVCRKRLGLPSFRKGSEAPARTRCGLSTFRPVGGYPCGMEAIAAIAGFVGRFILYFVGEVLIDAMIVNPLTRLNDRRLAKASTFHCGIRVMSGELPGFTKAWRHGTTTIGPRVILFKDEVIRVLDSAAHARQPMLGETYWSSFDHRVVVITTETAEIEFAARRPHLPTIRRRLTFPD